MNIQCKIYLWFICQNKRIDVYCIGSFILSEQPIKSLGWQYTAELSDIRMERVVMKQLSEGLARKYKVWYYHFMFYGRVMWPLKMSEIPSFTSKMDGKANLLSEMGLFGRNTFQLLLGSISLDYRQEKTKPVLKLRESTDQTVRNVNANVPTGWRWNAQTAVNQAISRLHHQEIGRSSSESSPGRKSRTRVEKGTTILVQGKLQREEGDGDGRGDEEGGRAL